MSFFRRFKHGVFWCFRLVVKIFHEKGTDFDLMLHNAKVQLRLRGRRRIFELIFKSISTFFYWPWKKNVIEICLFTWFIEDSLYIPIWKNLRNLPFIYLEQTLITSFNKLRKWSNRVNLRFIEAESAVDAWKTKNNWRISFSSPKLNLFSTSTIQSLIFHVNKTRDDSLPQEIDLFVFKLALSEKSVFQNEIPICGKITFLISHF